MFSPSAVQYSSRLTEVPKMENDLVLDLSIRTQEDSNMCHGEPIYSDGEYEFTERNTIILIKWPRSVGLGREYQLTAHTFYCR